MLERFKLPFDTLPTRTQLEQLVRDRRSARIQRFGSARQARPRRAAAHATWHIRCKPGNSATNCFMVFLPGEVVVDYVLRLKKEFDPARLWVTAYANDVPCYIPSERILREGGYEGGGAMVYYGRPTRLKPGVEALIIDAVHRCAGVGF